MNNVIYILIIAFLFVSCRSTRIDYSKTYQYLIEDELKIKDFFKNGSYQTLQLEMTDGQLVAAKHGINHIILNKKDTLNFTLTIEEGSIHSLSKSYTNYQGYRINKRFNILNNEIEITTTNSTGDIIGIYVESYFSGQYSDITIDSLGQSFEEWGNTNRKYR